MLNDIRFAFRQFAKAPGFTAVVVLSLALGIAANATAISWLEQLVLRPMPGVERQGDLVVLKSNIGGGNVSLPDLQDIRRSAASVFSGVAASMPTAACLTVDRTSQWFQAQVVTAGFFDVLGVRPLIGRTFRADDDQKPGGNPVIVISERLWRGRFGADPGILGRVVDLNRTAFTVIGVVPADFEGSLPPLQINIWAPASMIAEVRNQGRYFLTQRNARGWHNILRLQPGVSLREAQAVLSTVDSRMTAEYPKENREIHHVVLPLPKAPWGGPTVMGPALRLLVAVSLGVQLIVTANIANLLLARAMDRRREVAIRLAAGAGRLRLIRQFLTESVLLALIGGTVGIVMTNWTMNGLRALLPDGIAGKVSFAPHLDPLTLALTLLITVVTGVLFGMAPALQVTGADVATTLKDGGRGGVGASRAQQRVRRLLVVAEVALALVLLVCAALCAKGLRQAQQVDVGFKAAGVVVADLQIGMNGYNATTGLPFYRELRQRLASAPGVEEASLASWLPLGLLGCKGTGVDVEGYQRPPGEDPTYEFAVISPRYFATMRIPLAAGRDFTDADDADAAKVAIVNENFARRFWPGQDPIGRRFRSGGAWRTVVGVAKAGKYNRIDEEPGMFLYLPYLQGVPDLDLNVCVRGAADSATLAGIVRATVREIDPAVELLTVRTLASYSGAVFFPHRMASQVLLLLGAVALFLAAMGVHAVIAYTVSQRTKEFAVRMALGAQPRDLLTDVVRHGMVLAVLGIGAGVLLAVLVSRLLRGFLFGVSPFDPMTYLAVAGLLLVVAILACVLPARRAMRIEPVDALRAE